MYTSLVKLLEQVDVTDDATDVAAARNRDGSIRRADEMLFTDPLAHGSRAEVPSTLSDDFATNGASALMQQARHRGISEESAASTASDYYLRKPPATLPGSSFSALGNAADMTALGSQHSRASDTAVGRTATENRWTSPPTSGQTQLAVAGDAESAPGDASTDGVVAAPSRGHRATAMRAPPADAAAVVIEAIADNQTGAVRRASRVVTFSQLLNLQERGDDEARQGAGGFDTSTVVKIDDGKSPYSSNVTTISDEESVSQYDALRRELGAALARATRLEAQAAAAQEATDAALAALGDRDLLIERMTGQVERLLGSVAAAPHRSSDLQLSESQALSSPPAIVVDTLASEAGLLLNEARSLVGASSSSGLPPLSSSVSTLQEQQRPLIEALRVQAAAVRVLETRLAVSEACRADLAAQVLGRGGPASNPLGGATREAVEAKDSVVEGGGNDDGSTAPLTHNNESDDMQSLRRQLAVAAEQRGRLERQLRAAQEALKAAVRGAAATGSMGGGCAEDGSVAPTFGAPEPSPTGGVHVTSGPFAPVSTLAGRGFAENSGGGMLFRPSAIRRQEEALEAQLRAAPVFQRLSRTRVGAAVTHAASGLDRIGARAARVLGGNATLRIICLLYVIVLHLYVAHLVSSFVHHRMPHRIGTDVHDHIANHLHHQ